MLQSLGDIGVAECKNNEIDRIIVQRLESREGWRFVNGASLVVEVRNVNRIPLRKAACLPYERRQSPDHVEDTAIGCASETARGWFTDSRLIGALRPKVTCARTAPRHVIGA